MEFGCGRDADWCDARHTPRLTPGTDRQQHTIIPLEVNTSHAMLTSALVGPCWGFTPELQSTAKDFACRNEAA